MWACFCLFLSFSLGSLTPDPPVVGPRRLVLKNWSLKSGSLVAANVSVPGDLVTDLFRSGIIPEPHTDHNWLKYSHFWWGREWVYAAQFDLPWSEALLVFDGVKMGAFVNLNGVQISNVPNQFLRYSFNVSGLLKSHGNVLTLTFPANINNSTEIDTEGRFMACSGGWDWAPYGNYFDERGSRVQSRGIWKDIYLVDSSSVVVDQVVPVTSFVSGSTFMFNLTIHYRSNAATIFDFHVGWNSRRQSFPAPSTNGQLASVSVVQNVTITDNNLWNPRASKLFNVSVCHQVLGGCFYQTRVGFRSLKLVTTSKDDKITGNGSGNFTMRLEVNGVPQILRGGNWIPSALFEGLVTKNDLRASVKHAFDAGFNVLRIWGGGIYQYEDFYAACDEFGIVLYHDMMMTSSGMLNPVAPPPSNHSPSYLNEISYQIRRLSPHPSIVIYDSCNECGVAPIYEQVFAQILQEDISRIVWPSCPSNGWTSGVDSETGLPLGFGVSLAPAPQGNIYNGVNEHHGPYLHGTGSPYINDPSGKLVLFDSLVPPVFLDTPPVGLEFPGAFISEFGCVGMSSDFSMNATLSPESRDLHSSDMLLRNYPCDNLLIVYFGKVSTSWSWNLYACMQSQAMYLTGRIAQYRAANVFGIQIWQLNEIFPTGGWGTIETAEGTIPSGQLQGGRWKAAHYCLQSFVFTDNFFYCYADARCVVRRDTIASQEVHYSLAAIDVVSGTRLDSFAYADNTMDAFSIKWFCAGNSSQSSNCPPWSSIVPFAVNNTLIEVKRSNGAPFYIPLAPPQFMALPAVSISAAFPGDDSIVLTSNATAAFVWLSASNCQPLENNLFLFVQDGPKRVKWQPGCDMEIVQKTLRINHAREQ